MKYKLIIYIIIALAINSYIVIAQPNIEIDALSAMLNVDEDSIKINVNYTLKNNENKEKILNLKYLPLNKIISIKFEPYEKKNILIDYEIPLDNTSNLQVFNFNPMLLYNNAVFARINIYNVALTIPKDNKLLSTSKEDYTISEYENKRTYTWLYYLINSPSLGIRFTQLPYDLTVQKSIDSEDNIINVHITIKNNNDMAIDNLTIVDYYRPLEFEIIDNEDFKMIGMINNQNFKTYKIDKNIKIAGKELKIKEDISDQQINITNDVMIIWSTNIDLLPLEIKEIDYKIKVRLPEIGYILEPSRLFLNNTLIAYSNEVKIGGKLCGDHKCNYGEDEISCPLDCHKQKLNYLIILIPILIIITFVVIYLIYKRKIHG